MADSPWPIIHSERMALADDLAGLTAAQWQTPPLCAGRPVLDVTGHAPPPAKKPAPQLYGPRHAAGVR